MVIIAKAAKKDTIEFSKKEWHKMDDELYGGPVDWKEKKFRFKATEDGRLVGVISGKHESGVVYIDQLIVAERERGKGVGERLLKETEEFGKRMGAHKVWLITGKDWKANGFYKRLGYEKIADLIKHNFGKDFVIYSRFMS